MSTSLKSLSVDIVSTENVRLRNEKRVVLVTLGISYLAAMQLPWSRVELVATDGQRQTVNAKLGFVSPLDAPAVVSLDLEPSTPVTPGSRLAFAVEVNG